jgi:hypothetical protein
MIFFLDKNGYIPETDNGGHENLPQPAADPE